MEELDLGLDSLDTITLDLPPMASSGGGAASGNSFGLELLMNDKKKHGGAAAANQVKVSLSELDNIENDLNDLSSSNPQSLSSSSSFSAPLPPLPMAAPAPAFAATASSSVKTSSTSSSTTSGSSMFDSFTSMFSFGGGGGGGGGSSGDIQSSAAAAASNAESKTIQGVALGQAAKDTSLFGAVSRTWDGFTKFSDVPMGASSGGGFHERVVPVRLTEREKAKKKKMMLKKLDEWREKGTYRSHQHFSDDSAYEEVEDEYEQAMEEKRKKDSIKLYGWWFMTFVNTLEYGNSHLNPFDLNLDGWGEQVSEDIDSYEELFGEMYEKYKGAKLAPEVNLVMRLGFSAAMVNFTNKAFSTATPGYHDVIRQSPELMKAFQTATANSMAQQSPAFSFVNDMLNPQVLPKTGTSSGQAATAAGPPAPISASDLRKPIVPPVPLAGPSQPVMRGPQTKMPMSFLPSMSAMNNSSSSGAFPLAADVQNARGAMFREPGVDMSGLASASAASAGLSSAPFVRPELQGPRVPVTTTYSAESLLAGLKPNPASSLSTPNSASNPILHDIFQQGGGGGSGGNQGYATTATPSMPSSRAATPKYFPQAEDVDSRISVASLQDITGTSNVPSRSSGRRKRTNSEKNMNVVSLDTLDL